ncbi:MAG TPA: hypothetical protein VI504_06520 [Candidatus Eisenbacteria bacterium]|jgi:hypothetical protein
MRLSARAARAPATSLDALLVMLSVSGLAFWFVVGLPWGPHNESFAWVVGLEQRSFLEALFQKFPSVLSLRPLGTGPAWLLYRLAHHDVAGVQLVNAALALLAWGWAARDARERRLFALLSLAAGGVFFAGYIWVFHLHGIFYGPLLLYVASLARAARGPLDLRTLLGVFVGALVTALAHPYALPLAVAFVLGAMVETPLLRTRAGAAALGVVITGAVAAYLLLVPGSNRGVLEPPLAGFVASFRTLEVNAIGSGIAGLLAAWTASRALPGAAGGIAALFTLVVAGAGIASGLPVLPLWIAWAAAKSVRRGRWTMAALLGATALLPIPNPTGSPTYAIFAVFVAVCATALDETGSDRMLHVLRAPQVAGMLAGLLALALAVRAGVAVPIVSRIARPLLAEGERTRQLEVLGARLMESPWRNDRARFLHPALNPSDADAVDRRFRPPAQDSHLSIWLDWKRGGPPTGADTLVFTFGGESVPGMDTVLAARGRYAGDALVLRRSSAAVAADGARRTPP